MRCTDDDAADMDENDDPLRFLKVLPGLPNELSDGEIAVGVTEVPGEPESGEFCPEDTMD